MVLELLVKQFYAIDVGFAQVRCRNDWLRPKGEVKNWKSKVDFEIIQRINPKAGDPRRELVRAAETEVHAELQRDALLSKARAESRLSLNDPINS